MGTEVSITGLDDLYRTLQDLPGQIEGNVMRGALRAGQKVMLDQVKAQVPVDQGDLLRSLRISLRGKSQKYGWVRMNLVAGNKTAWYAHLVEYGTASYYTGKGKTVGKPYEIKPKKGKALFFFGKAREHVEHPGIKPQPFMRPGFDTGHEAALTAVRDYIAQRLPREVKKAGTA